MKFHWLSDRHKQKKRERKSEISLIFDLESIEFLSMKKCVFSLPPPHTKGINKIETRKNEREFKVFINCHSTRQIIAQYDCLFCYFFVCCCCFCYWLCGETKKKYCSWLVRDPNRFRDQIFKSLSLWVSWIRNLIKKNFFLPIFFEMVFFSAKYRSTYVVKHLILTVYVDITSAVSILTNKIFPGNAQNIDSDCFCMVGIVFGFVLIATNKQKMSEFVCIFTYPHEYENQTIVYIKPLTSY